MMLGTTNIKKKRWLAVARPSCCRHVTQCFQTAGKPRMSPAHRTHILRKGISQPNLHISRFTESFLLTDCHLLRNIDVRSITVLYIALSGVKTPYQVCRLDFSGFSTSICNFLSSEIWRRVNSWSLCSGVQCCYTFIAWNLFQWL